MRTVQNVTRLRAFMAGAVMALVIAWAAPLLAQGVRLMGGASSDLVAVNSFKAIEFITGRATRPTYIASAGAQATTAAIIMSIESAAGTGFRLIEWCVGMSNATAAAAVTVTVQRRTTASSAGTAATAEGTGTTVVSKMDPSDGNYGGVVRIGGTPGTGGAVLDQVGFQVGEIAAGTADPLGQAPFCKEYGNVGGKAPTVAAGVANGLSINISAPGAGGLASGSIAATIVAE